MTGQTRWALSLVHCGDATYGLPLAGGTLSPALHHWARTQRARHLGVIVPAGTCVAGVEVGGNVLVECNLDGTRVLIPRDAIEQFN
jgi:hypothetical protein